MLPPHAVVTAAGAIEHRTVNEQVSGPSWFRFVGAFVGLAVCAGAQWYIYEGQHWDRANPAVVLGAIAAAILLGRPQDTQAVTRTTPPSTVPLAWPGLVVSTIGFGILCWAVYLLSTDWQQHFDFAAPLSVVGVAVWCMGLALAESKPAVPVNASPLLRWELVTFLLILALGFFLRFYRYADFPPPGGVCAVEEPQSGQAAYNILTADWRPWEFVGDRWLGALGLKLFGPSVMGLRLPFAFVSAITIIPFFFLVRELVSRPAALLATLLFASCRWHLIYARLAHAVYPTTLIVVVLLYLCVRVHKRGGLALYPLVGFLSGYTLYAYAGYRGTSLFVGLFFTISFLIHLSEWWRAPDPAAGAVAARIVRQQLAGFGLAALAAVALLIVLASQLRTNPTFFFEALVRATDDTAYYTADRTVLIAQRINRIKMTAMMFNHLGDDSGTFNLPGRPMLDPVSGMLLTIALGYCVVWGRHRWQGFFAFMFLVLLVMGTIFVHNFDIRRLQGIIPLIFVLVAFLADRIGQVCAARLGRGARPALVVLGFAIAALAFADNFNVYVRQLMNDLTVRRTFQNAYTLPIRYLHTLPDNAYFLLVADQLNFFLPSDFEWLRGTRVPGSVTSDLMPVLTGQPGPWAGRDLRVLIANPFEHDDLVRLLRARFPQAQCGRMTDIDIAPHFRFTWCTVPAPAKPMPLETGVHARYFRGDATTPIVDRIEPAIAFGLLPDACRFPAALEQPPCRGEWEGTWDVPQPGTYHLAAEVRNGDMALTVDDHLVQGPVQLTAGPHVVRLRARFRSIEEPGVRLELRNPATNELELLQFTELAPDSSTP
jgi:hypothetical protein